MRVNACQLAIGGYPWDWAQRHREQIALNWQHQRANNPAFFDGVIQMLVRYSIDNGVFIGDFSTSDFASFIYWRGQGFADMSVRDCFGCAILRSADGHLLLGRQAAGNLNAGRVYCPGGFIDTADVRADRSIDIDGSIAREIAEETGLDAAMLLRQPGYILAAGEASIAIGVEYRSALTAEAMRAQILRHIASEDIPELADIMIVRRPGDLDGVPAAAYVGPLLRALF